MNFNINRYQHQRLNAITLLAVLLAALLSVLVGCNSIDKAASMVIPFYSYDKTELSQIGIVAESNSNANMPVEIDFVFIYNKVVDPVLKGFSGPDWFANKASILLQHQQDLVIRHIEIVPLTVTEKLTLPEGYDNAIKVMMYANYSAKPGQYAVDITLFDELQITLKQAGYQLKELNP
jgi:hypothetical protein